SAVAGGRSAGTLWIHEALEAELAAFKGTEAVLTFQSGFSANTGVIPTITGDDRLWVLRGANTHRVAHGGFRRVRARLPHPRLDHRRHAPLEGAAQGLPARRRGGTARDPRRG